MLKKNIIIYEMALLASFVIVALVNIAMGDYCVIKARGLWGLKLYLLYLIIRLAMWSAVIPTKIKHYAIT